VLIVAGGVFSLCHPSVRKAFSESPFFNSEQAALVTISPFNPYGLTPNDILEEELRKRLGIASSRFANDYDAQCEFGIGDEQRLKRWLHHSLPETLHILREPKPNPESLERFAAGMGRQSDDDEPNWHSLGGGLVSSPKSLGRL
jgi:hypothetical protein